MSHSRPRGVARIVVAGGDGSAEADDMDRHSLPLNRNLDPADESHSGFLSRLPGAPQTTQIVMIGERPEVDTIRRGPSRDVLWRQQAVRNHGMAMEVEVGWSHG